MVRCLYQNSRLPFGETFTHYIEDYTYDSAGRMATFSIGGVLQASYRYDFAGRQVVRALTLPTAVTIHSVFDSAGNRIAEYNEATGALIREYVWLNGEPLAVIEGGAINYVRVDHIGRPVFATNSTGTKVWTASYLPFGEVRTTTGTPIALRFPGRWFQSESGLHQNWIRDYDPTTGRYLQADPLGLIDGASVYGYVKQNPGRWVDPRGEEVRGYSSGQAFGSAAFNHAFIYGTECNCAAGTGGSSGTGGGDNGGNMTGRPYTIIIVPDGYSSEQSFIDDVRERLDGGIYFPILNDCHVQLSRAMDDLGVENYPGVPNGRSDLDDNISNYIDRTFNEIFQWGYSR